jgi:uncharacterized protein GlcG (DUF336 family)
MKAGAVVLATGLARAFAGGVPIKAGNDVIGGVGAGGAPGGEKDEARASAGLAKVADQLK